MFRRWLPVFLLFLSLLPVRAYEGYGDSLVSIACRSGLKEESVKVLMSYDGEPEKFSRLVEAARRLDVPEQTLREARFFFCLQNQDERGLAALADEFAVTLPSFREQDSELCSSKRDWLAVIAFVRGIQKRLAGDDEGFERGMKQAFWLSPRQATAFAPFVHKHQVRQVLRHERIEKNFSLTSVSGSRSTFSQWRKGSKGVVFHFISLWDKRCDEHMPDFIETRKVLEEHGFIVISVVVQSAEKIKLELPNYLKRIKMRQEDLYYDLPRNSLAGRLCIEALPAMALVNSKGKILFSGIPDEPEFWEKLQELNPDIKRPLLTPVRHSQPSSFYEPLD